MILNYDEKSLYERFPSLTSCKDEIEKVLQMMLDTYNAGGKILLCGNGGSCADCDHIVGELMKSFMIERKPKEEFCHKLREQFGDNTDEVISSLQTGIPSISLPAHAAVLTAYLNDVKPEYVYAQLTYGYGKKEDLLIVSAVGFGCPGYVRISYCVDYDMIERSFGAFERLYASYQK